MNKLFFLILFLIATVNNCARALVIEPAMIYIDHDNDFKIINLEDNSEHAHFQVTVASTPYKDPSGSLNFKLKIEFSNFKEKVKFNNQLINDTIYVSIPPEELSNKTFHKTILLQTYNPKFKLEPITIKIDPNVAITADQKKISFGRIYSNGHYLISSSSPSVMLRYSILTNAACEIHSKNNFKLCNQNSYIPYAVNNITENGEIILDATKQEYIANFRILPHRTKIYAGNYTDTITFTIKSTL